MSGKKLSLRKEVFYPHPPQAVWTALTDKRALAEWLMPNNFEPVKGCKFQFRVDPVRGIYSGIQDCEVLEVDPPKRLVFTWVVVPIKPEAPRPKPMTLEWTLAPKDGGTLLTLQQSGLEHLGWWNRFSMKMGWNRMLKTLLPKVLGNVQGSAFTPGAIKRRDYGTKTVPEDFAK